MHPIRRALALAGVGLLTFTAAPAHADAEKDYRDGVAAYDRGDVVAAMDLLQRAVDEGHVPAMVRLAYVLDKSESNAEAFRMYRRAADAGNAEAALAISVMYANGEGVQRDRGAALQWMTRSAEAGHGPAIVALAKVYLRGDLGVAANREEALRWLQKGAAAGFEPAAAELERLRKPEPRRAR